VGEMAFSGQGESLYGTMGTLDRDVFIIFHVLEILERTLCHRQLHVTSQRPLGCGYGYVTKAMPQAHFFKKRPGAWCVI
jgi:hypothetical protein